MQVDSNSASAAPIPTGIWQPGGSGHAFSTHQQQAPTRYPSGFGTQYGIEHLPSGQQIFRAQSPTQQQFRDQGGRWYEARQHQNAHAAALQAQLAARLQDQHSQQQHLLVIEQLQRQRQANMAAAQQAQNRAQGGAALMRDFPQLAQAQQHLMAQQAAARQEAVAAQTAAAVALLHGQQGQAHHHQAWGHGRPDHSCRQANTKQTLGSFHRKDIKG